MKKLIVLVCLLFAVGMSANLFAQSTYTSPYLGATHTYSVTDHSGSFVWTVTKGDLSAAAGTDVTITNGTTATATILWAADAATDTDYYIRVVETISGCSNTKILKVRPVASAFHAVITANSATGCYGSAVAATLDGSGDPVYTHGTATVVYTITPTNRQGNWKFDFANTAVAGWTWAAPTVTAGDATISGSTVTATSGTAVQLSFVVTKTATNSNGDDAAGTAADFTSTITISNGKTGAGYTISDDGTGSKSGATAVSRPHTTTITGS